MVMAYLYVAGTRAIEHQVWETIDAEITGLLEQYNQSGLTGLTRALDQRSTFASERNSVYMLIDGSGQKIAGDLNQWPAQASDSRVGFGFVLPPRSQIGPVRPPNLRTGSPALARSFLLPGNSRLLVGRDVQEQVDNQRVLRNVILLGAFVMSILGVVAGYIVSRWMLSRLERVNQTTRRIMAGELSRRIDVEGGGDEFDELAENVNNMLERIERLLAGMRQVTDNIAHDLRTPLHRLRARIEVALLQELDEQESRQLLEDTVRDADDLIETFNALLRIARLEAGAQQSDWEPLDLDEVARDVVELYEPLAEDKSITLQLEGATTTKINGSHQLIAQAISNLTDNAIKYTQEGGHITISTNKTHLPAITVADNGPGIPAEQRQNALERFVRLAPERSEPGNGLGLSLVQAVARLHRAELDLKDNQPGLAVTMTFPNAHPDQITAKAAASKS